MARTNLIRQLPGRREPALKLSMLAACSVLALSAPVAVANPQGGEVAAGQATISNPNASTTQINQQSDKAVVNWSSFNIGTNESTVFVQPNASSITLNRIFDANPSVIAGLLTANGRLILVNRNGMMFEGSAVIDTAGLVASTADISDENFLAGRYNFDIAGNPGAKISNAGSIVVKPEGLVAMVAPTVENTGLISAKLGRIGVGAGSTFILDIQGENLVGFPISAEVAQHLIGPDGELVDTQVLVPARAARALVEDIMKPSGYTIATGAEQTADGVRFTGAAGSSWLSVQNAAGGSVALGGTLDVSGARAGSVAVTGDTVLATGTIQANGALGGNVNIAAKNLLTAGRIDADGAYLGGGVTLNALNRQIATSSTNISANGGIAGGTIALSGGGTAGQGLFSSGTYTATSSAGVGGAVTVNGNDLKLIDAKVDVSGATGGGRIAVGYTGEGASRVVGTDTLLVSPTSTFKADATSAGDGGRVVFWSNLSSDFMGTLTAKGGALSGNGGFLEVSSKGDVGFWGLGDASAAQGAAGMLSLDPKNLIISNTGSTFPSYQLIDPSASAGNLFGGAVAVLSTGRTVVTAAQDDFAASNAGAVYVYNTLTGALVSTLLGSTANNLVGSGGITVLSNGNFVVASPNWDNGAATDAGAATWVNGTSGLSAAVGLANSYVGTASNNQVSSAGIVALTNGNYVVRSPSWDNGGTSNVGAATWGDGTTGSSGAVGAANSLIGSATDDQVSGSAVVALSNGNFVVNSQLWNNGASTDAGAVTWGNGTTGRYGPGAVFGAVSAANSLVGSSSNDRIGEDGLVGLTNGNFVFASAGWNNGGTTNAGAVTWGNGAAGTGAAGVLSSSNSLIGGASNAEVGSGGVVALSNGNYVAISPGWDNGGFGGQGAVTWGNGATGTFGTVTALNSVIGASSGDNIGSGGVRALTNGNFVIASPNFDAGAGSAHGAVTWRSGAAASNITVGLANSLLGVTGGDNIGSGGIVALSNGNYVVVSPNWDNGGTSNVGAVTWGDGTAGTTGQVTNLISTIGVTSGDTVGSGGVFALTNGNYVIASPNFDTNGGAAGNTQGAVTWRSGASASSGTVSAANSLTGSTSGDNVGSAGVVALSNGNYVVRSPNWDNGATTNVGAVTWANGTAATSATVGAANSLIGSTASDQIGSGGVTALSTGDYIVASPLWNNGATADAGAVTLGVGTGGTVGAVTATNSIAAATANAQLTYAGTSGANEYAARSSAAGQVFMGITDPAQVTFARAQGQTLTVNPAFITRTLNTGTAVTLQVSNDITLASDLLVNNASGNGGALTLLAGRSVLLNANITTDNGNLTIVANDLLASGVIDAQRDPGSAVLAMASGTTINAGTGDVRLTIASGAGKTNTASGNLTLSNVTAGTLIAENLGPSNGNVVINAASTLAASGAGTPLVLASQGGNFINNAGGGALSTPSGRWIVYSQTPGANTIGGMTGSPYYNTAYNSAAPTALSATGNRFAYTTAPVLTVTANNATRTYGDANPAFTYGITGLIGGDNLAAAVTGAPNLSTLATPTTSVGNYAIATALGSLVSDYNYGFSLVDGQLTINPATLTYLADPKSRLYGGANPALTGSISGFKNGEDINTATTGTMTFTTAATATSNVGGYAIDGGGLTALNGNYVFAQDASNATALTINPATLTYIANPSARLYGAANPAFTGTVTGFQNGEDINTATTGALAFTSPATATSNVGSYAINGGGLTALNGNYVFVQDAGNATALTINPATLTYLADPKSRLYGGANPALTGTVTGFQNGEDIATATTGTLAFATLATPTSNVGSYAIDGSGLTANNGNYVFVQAASNATALTIDPATLTYLADPKSRLYGGANPALTGSISGFQNGEDINTATTGTMTFTTAATATSNVGSYAINGGGLTALNGNYVFAQDAGNATALTINPATLTYLADPKSRLYGGANPALTGSISGFQNGEEVNTATTGTMTFTTAATATTNVGSYAINGGGLTALNGNYVFVQDAGNATALTINPATLTYVADPQSRLYGDANPALTGTVTGFQNGEDINTATTGALTFATAATAASNVGSYAIDGSGLTANNGNYVFVQAAANATALTINPATLTYLADPKSRLYGDANPALTGSISGFKNGEDANTATTGTMTFTTAAAATSNVGNYAINGGGLTANNGNYVFAQDVSNATALTINPSTLTYVADPKSRLYGDANPAFTGAVTGFKNGEDVGTATTGTLTFASLATPTSNVGTYAIDGSGLTANNGNYVFVQAAGNATALTINPSTLTYIADPQSRLYGDANPAFTGTVTGFKNGEDINTATTGALTFSSLATPTSNVGTYAIDGSGLTANNGNYIFVQAAANATALTINPATLTYTADPASRLYGDANPAFTGSVAGFKNGETVGTATSGTLAFTTAATATSNVGNYAINGGGLTANNGNYIFAQDVSNATALTINPATLTYVADPKSRLYGDANPAFTGSVTGFKNGEDVGTATTGTLTFASLATPTSNVGTYAIDGSGLTANNGNYVFVQAAGSATALTINPSTLTYIADPQSRLYGDANPAFTGTVTGFKNGEDINTATTGALAFASLATPTSNVGNYAIDGSGLTANNGNYVFVQAAGNATALTINPATLTYTADPASRLYGDANPAFTGSVAGFKNGETVGTATSGTLTFTTAATATSNVGTYAINGGGLTALNGNYIFAQDVGNATALTINPSTLTYVADPKSRLYGDANPALTGAVTGFKNGEDVSTATTGALTFASLATPTSNVGSYAIDGSGLTANNGNYVFTQAAGNATALTINPATLTYVADPASRLYGDANPAFTGTVTGFKNGESLATATTGAAAFTTAATTTSNVGSYAIDGSGLTAINGNYVFAQAAANATALTIDPATLTYTADPASRLYGDPNPAFTGSLAGFKNGEDINTATTGAMTFTSPATGTSNVGTHAINGGGLTANNGNYVFAQAAGNATALTINPATLTYLADPKSRLYGDANPALTGTVTGFKNGETIATATTGALAFTTSATATSNVGSYAINGSGLTANSGNYVFVQDPGNAVALTINPATLIYVADPASRLYGDANPAFTGTVTGFKNGESLATATTGAVAFTTGATATSNVGSYAIDGSGLTANNGNYVFTQDPGNAAALTINPATLTYTADPASRLYGDPNPAFTGSVAGFKNGESLAAATSGAMTFTSPATGTSTVGTHAINGGGLTANNGNYVFAQAAGNATALTINPATLTYLADPKSRLYGDANPALTGTVTGFKNGETIATATTGALSFATTATAASNVGNNAITGSGLTAANYVFVQDASNATALAINPATLTFVADPNARLYGAANPAFTGTVTGFKNGETVATATTGALAFTTTATATTNVGAYAVNGGGLTALNGNYVFAQAVGNATALLINPATLTYVADPATRLYAQPNPAFTGTVTGFQNGETIATATTGALAFTSPANIVSVPGTYAINGGGLTAVNGNYVFTQAASNATALTINANPSVATIDLTPTLLQGQSGEGASEDETAGADEENEDALQTGPARRCMQAAAAGTANLKDCEQRRAAN